MEDKRPSFEEACKFVSMLHFKSKFPFDQIERKLRNAGIPIYLFGEDHTKSKYTSSCSIPTGKFCLLICVKRCRELALCEAEPGCHDVDVNLERLKSTMFAQMASTSAFVERQVKAMCTDEYNAAIQHCYAKSLCNEFRSYFLSHPEEAAICAAKNIRISEMEPKVLQDMTFLHAPTKTEESSPADTTMEEEDDDAFVEREINRMCQDSYDKDACQYYSREVCTKFRRYFLTHPEEALICARKNIQIKEKASM